MPRSSTVESDQIVALVCSPGHYVVARWRNLTLVYWMAQADSLAVRRIREITAQMASAFPGGFSSIHLVRNGAPLPDSEARKGFSDIMAEYAQQMACIGVVLMGAGFWASALQGMITGFSMVAKRSYVLRFAREPAEVCAWFPGEHHKRSGQAIEPAALAAAMDEVIQLGGRSEPEPKLAAV